MSYYVKMGLYSNILQKETKKIYISLCNETKKRLQGKRQVMFSDLINVICSKDLIGKEHIQILWWCNFNIKKGHHLVDTKFYDDKKEKNYY